MSNIGRGLKDLFEENYLNIDQIQDGEIICNIPLSKIKPNPYQPRKVFDEDKIKELALSISENGVFQPIILKEFGNEYIIVSGERRYRACKMLHLETIPAIIRAYDESKVAEIALIENLQRENLTPMEEAGAYQNIMKEIGLTQAELAKKIGKSRSHITNMVGLLSLPEEVATLVSDGKITMGHARPLSKLKDKKRIIEIAKEIVNKGLSVRDVEEITKNEKKAKTIKVSSNKYEKIEKRLSAYLGCKVKVSDDKITLKMDKSARKEVIGKIMGE